MFQNSSPGDLTENQPSFGILSGGLRMVFCHIILCGVIARKYVLLLYLFIQIFHENGKFNFKCVTNNKQFRKFYTKMHHLLLVPYNDVQCTKKHTHTHTQMIYKMYIEDLKSMNC